MSFLAPYTNAMRLGQGFNSYTQEICIENAVVIEPAKRPRTSFDKRPSSLVVGSRPLKPQTSPRPHSETSVTLNHQPSNESMASNTAVSDAGSHGDPKTKAVPDLTVGTTGAPLPAKPVLPVEEIPPHKNIVQIVTYSSRMVDNVSDIVEALNISSSASIKYGTIKGAGSSSIVNENKVNQSDLNYIVTVKVTNETSPVGERFTFNPIPELENSKFTEVFGDCFISGFTEGGEFNAIVSIKVNDKSRISAVKAAAEAEIAIAAAPGLSVGTKNSFDRNKSDVWDDTEITISVTWAGGGDLKPADEKWDLKTVVDVATRFPHLVQTCAQRTSAILTRYTSLRSFNEANARNPPDDKFKILDYELCSLYTQDLFNAFLAYKNIRTELSDMLKSPEQYREREPSSDVPNPIRLNAKEMSEATQMARKAMVQVKDITKALITNPSLADLDENGQQRPVPYAWPGELRKRLPIRHHGQTIREQADFVRRDTNYALLTGPELAKISAWARDEDLEFSPLAGDHLPIQRSWVDGKSTDTLFCTLDTASTSTTTTTSTSSSRLDPLTKLRIHAHENRSINWLGIFGLETRSKRCHGHVSAIGYSTSSDETVPARNDGVHHIAGKANRNPRFWGEPVADLTRSKAVKVRVEYMPGSGCLAALVVLDAMGQELTSWKAYGLARGGAGAGLKRVEQEPPDQSGGWSLVGFWGHADGIVVNSVGAIWRKG